MGRGDGTFAVAPNGLPASIATLQQSFLSCLIVDVDGDGFQDLVLGAANPNGSSNSLVLFNDGNGDFTRRPQYVLPQHPIGAGATLVMDIVALDVNRDGLPDLLMMATQYPSNTGAGLQVLINGGDCTFADETAARLGASAFTAGGSSCGFLKLADFNGDGWEDFYCNIGPQNVPNRYWMSNGDGTWAPLAPSLLSQGSGFGIHAVDFDGDGRPDLLQLSHTLTGDISYNSFLNRTPRTVPSEPVLGAAAAGDAQASISFTTPRGNGTSPITGYTATCSPGTLSGAGAASGAASPITVSGLTNGTLYSCSVKANTQAGPSPASGAAAVRPAAGLGSTTVSLNLVAGWNLVGNGSGSGLDVAGAFGDAGKVLTVWKWMPSQSKWAFYTPSLAGQQLTDYATGKGYDVMATINGGEGFWVNAKQAFTAQLLAGPTMTAALLRNMPVGWNLISIGESNTPSQFNSALGFNVTTLWAWDSAQSGWYFYAPSLEKNGELTNYITGKGYLNFTAASKTLAPGVGFWVNRP